MEAIILIGALILSSAYTGANIGFNLAKKLYANKKLNSLTEEIDD
jgi:hypothetical protein